MLKSSPIFLRNDANLVEKKDVWKKQRIFTFKVCVFWTWIFFLFVSSFEHVNFTINEKYSRKLWQSKLLCFNCDLSNIQKCSFKKCPLTWVAPLTMFLPIVGFIYTLFRLIHVHHKSMSNLGLRSTKNDHCKIYFGNFYTMFLNT